MTPDRDIERLLDTWFADGPMQVSDHVFDEAVGRVHRQRQRPAWRLLWKEPRMSAPFKAALAAAAVIVVFVTGFAMLRGSGGVIGGVTGPTASPSPTPSPAPSAAPTPQPMPEGVLPAGTYSTRPVTYASPLEATFTVPAGWMGYGGWAILGPGNTDAPEGIGIGFVTASGLLSNPCTSVAPGGSQVPVESIGPSVDDLVSALVAHGGYTASAPIETTLGGYAGKQLDLQLPADLGGCLGDRSRFFVWEENGGPSLYAQGPANIWHLKIVDVDGLRFIAVVTDYAATPASAKAEAQAILDSIVLQP